MRGHCLVSISALLFLWLVIGIEAQRCPVRQLCACNDGRNGTDGRNGLNGLNGRNGTDGKNGISPLINPLNNSIVPAVADAFDVGSLAKPFANVYTENLNASVVTVSSLLDGSSSNVVAGTLQVLGSTALTGGLVVTSTASFDNNRIYSDGLGDLTILGNTVLQGQLVVHGASTMTGNLTVTQPTRLTAGLIVSGAPSQLDGGSIVTDNMGNVAIGGNLVLGTTITTPLAGLGAITTPGPLTCGPALVASVDAGSGFIQTTGNVLATSVVADVVTIAGFPFVPTQLTTSITPQDDLGIDIGTPIKRIHNLHVETLHANYTVETSSAIINGNATVTDLYITGTTLAAGSADITTTGSLAAGDAFVASLNAGHGVIQTTGQLIANDTIVHSLTLTGAAFNAGIAAISTTGRLTAGVTQVQALASTTFVQTPTLTITGEVLAASSAASTFATVTTNTLSTNSILFRGIPFIPGIIQQTEVPVSDAYLSLGGPSTRWLDIYGLYGYFNNSLWCGGPLSSASASITGPLTAGSISTTGSLTSGPATVSSLVNTGSMTTTGTSTAGAFTTSGTVSADKVVITSPGDATMLGLGALQVAGGASVNKTLRVGGNAVVAGTLTVSGSAIIPASVLVSSTTISGSPFNTVTTSVASVVVTTVGTYMCTFEGLFTMANGQTMTCQIEMATNTPLDNSRRAFPFVAITMQYTLKAYVTTTTASQTINADCARTVGTGNITPGARSLHCIRIT